MPQLFSGIELPPADMAASKQPAQWAFGQIDRNRSARPPSLWRGIESDGAFGEQAGVGHANLQLDASRFFLATQANL